MNRKVFNNTVAYVNPSSKLKLPLVALIPREALRERAHPDYRHNKWHPGFFAQSRRTFFFFYVFMSTLVHFHSTRILIFFGEERVLLLSKSALNFVLQTMSSSSSSATSTSVVDQVLRLALFDHLPRKQYPRNPDSIEGDRVSKCGQFDNTIRQCN